MLTYYVWLTIELWFYAGFIISGIIFLFVRTLKTGIILELPVHLFSEMSDFLEVSFYSSDLILSFATPMVVTGWLLILNSYLKNDSVKTSDVDF